ncbi:MAG: glycine cleavage system protein GcvH [Spirochaetia bacterium]
MVEKDYLYTKDHEWIKVDGDTATMGITDFAQQELGDITFVEAPEVDSEFAQGDELGTVESVKSAGDIFCPVSGTVIEVNPELEDTPELINQDPYGKGWICKLGSINKDETKDLMNADAYEKFIQGQE